MPRAQGARLDAADTGVSGVAGTLSAGGACGPRVGQARTPRRGEGRVRDWEKGLGEKSQVGKWSFEREGDGQQCVPSL